MASPCCALLTPPIAEYLFLVETASSLSVSMKATSLHSFFVETISLHSTFFLNDFVRYRVFYVKITNNFFVEYFFVKMTLLQSIFSESHFFVEYFS